MNYFSGRPVKATEITQSAVQREGQHYLSAKSIACHGQGRRFPWAPLTDSCRTTSRLCLSKGHRRWAPARLSRRRYDLIKRQAISGTKHIDQLDETLGKRLCYHSLISPTRNSFSVTHFLCRGSGLWPGPTSESQLCSARLIRFICSPLNFPLNFTLGFYICILYHGYQFQNNHILQLVCFTVDLGKHEF